MKRLLELLRGWYWTRREDAALDRLAKAYRRHPLPHAKAMEEVQLRAHLEEFRDFASEAYLRDRSALAAIREAWTDTRLKALWKVVGHQRAMTLRKIVKEMPAHEMLHGPALAAWQRDCDRAATSFRAAAIGTHGPSGMTKHQRRVLRSV